MRICRYCTTNQPPESRIRSCCRLLNELLRAVDAETALESVLALIANRPMRTWTDIDIERFPGQAVRMGELFQAERSGLAPQKKLNPDEQQRSAEIAEDVQVYLKQHFDVDEDIIQAALQELLKRYVK